MSYLVIGKQCTTYLLPCEKLTRGAGGEWVDVLLAAGADEHLLYEELCGVCVPLGAAEVGEVVAEVRVQDLVLQQVALVQEEDHGGLVEPLVTDYYPLNFQG